MDARVQELVQGGHPERSASMIAEAERTAQAALRSAQATLRLAEQAVFDAIQALTAAREWWVGEGSLGACRNDPCASPAVRLRSLRATLHLLQAGSPDHRQEDDRERAGPLAVVHRCVRPPDPAGLPAQAAHGGGDADRMGDYVKAWAVARADPALQRLCGMVVRFYVQQGLLCAAAQQC